MQAQPAAGRWAAYAGRAPDVKAGDVRDWALHYGMSALPMTTCSDLGARLSPLMGKKAHPAQHRNAKALFATLRPDWAHDDTALEAAVDRLWANIGRTFAEFAVSHRMLRHGRVTVVGREWLDAATRSGRPIVAIFCHLGNWEVSEMQFGFHIPHRAAVVVDPPMSSARAAIAEKVRSRVPAELLPMSRTVWRRAVAKLKVPGCALMLAVDENVKGRVMGPAFAGTPDLDGNLGKAARLALMTNAIVLPFHNERLPGARFVTHYLPTMDLTGAPGDEGAVREAVIRMNAVMREPILRLLDQWYMALFARV